MINDKVASSQHLKRISEVFELLFELLRFVSRIRYSLNNSVISTSSFIIPCSIVRYSFCLSSFLSLSILSLAQKVPYSHPIKIISGDIVDFTVDNLDNIYVINSTGQIKKLNSNGDSVSVYNDVKKYGKVFLIDPSNPMKLLLYYKDFSTIVILDRLMNVRSTIDLRKHNIFQVKAIGLSYDNNIWLYDELENKLKKISEEGKLLSETSDFRVLFNEAPSPQEIFDRDGFVYLYDSARGIFVFDYYGALKNKILISRWENLKVIDKFIFGTIGDTLHRYEIKSFSLREETLPRSLKTAKALNFTNNRLYFLKDDTLEIYSHQ